MKRALLVGAMSVTLLWGGLALAQADAPVEEDLSELVETIIESGANGHWLVLTGAVIMLLVSLVRKFWTTMPKAWSPWISVTLGALLAMGSAWMTGQLWWQGLLTGVAAGLSAVGLYEMGGKKVLKPKPKEV